MPRRWQSWRMADEVWDQPERISPEDRLAASANWLMKRSRVSA